MKFFESKIFRIVFFTALCALWVFPAHAAKFNGERWAVVIGVEKYESPIPTLTSPIKDAEAIYAFLKSEQGGEFKDDHIKYLTGPQVTRDSIATALGTFLNQVNPEDYVVVYLSGHGMVESRHTTRYYFLPSGANAGNLSGTAVRMDNIYQWIEESPAGKKLIIADVCHSGAISSTGAQVKGGNPVHDYLKKLAKSYKGLGVFTSSRATQLSQEFKESEKRKDPEKEKSVFTYYLLQALGPKANEIDRSGKTDGFIDVKEAYEWVREQVRKKTSSEQIPDFKGDLDIGIPLAAIVRETGSGGGVGNGNGGFQVSNNLRLELDKEFWSAIKNSRNPQDFEDYIEKFGESGFYYSLAQRRLVALKEPPEPPPSTDIPPGMVRIPAGYFMMGADADVGFRECQKYYINCGRSVFENEEPKHKVYVDEFFMDKYEVTQEDFERVMGTNPSNFKGKKKPVDRVTWEEAKKYCKKVGKRLPTEAEWEKAAKGGQDWLYPWGNTFKAGYSNFCDTNCEHFWKRTEFDDGYKNAAPVGQYTANGYGLFDMGGNVDEWVTDWFDEGAYKGHEGVKNPRGPSSGTFRVIRGGSWLTGPRNLRAASRIRRDPAERFDYIGFRCTQ